MSDFDPGDKVTRGSTIAAGSAETTTHQFTGSVYITGNLCVDGIPTGSIAGAGSYIGLDTNNCFVLTASSGGGGGAAAGGSDTQMQYNDGGSALGGISVFTWDDTNLKIADDTKLLFGTNSDASIEYDENGRNKLIISGSAAGIEVTGALDVNGAVTLNSDAASTTTVYKLAVSSVHPGNAIVNNGGYYGYKTMECVETIKSQATISGSTVTGSIFLATTITGSIISGSNFYGDGSNLTGISAGGSSTPVDDANEILAHQTLGG